MKKYKIGDKIIIKSREDNYLMLRTLFYRMNCAHVHLAKNLDNDTLEYAQKRRKEMHNTISKIYPELKKYEYFVHTNLNDSTGDFVIMIYGEKK